jgi:hypothetical protein
MVITSQITRSARLSLAHSRIKGKIRMINKRLYPAVSPLVPLFIEIRNVRASPPPAR